MNLIIGGAYQGKLDYAKTTFHIEEDDIFVCTPDREPDFSKRCLIHYEAYILYCLRNGKEVCPSFREDSIILMEDIFCGVVPVDEEIRAWREACGRALTALAFRSETVTRLFCGLPMQLKPQN